MEWNRGKTLLLGNASPYVGARFDIGTDDMRLRRNRFRDLTKAIRAQRGDGAGPWWPCYGLVPADGPFWEDFAPYRAQVLSNLRGAWEAYAEPMEQVLAEAAS